MPSKIVFALTVLIAMSCGARAEENYPFCINFEPGTSLVYQLPRSALARQPAWSLGDSLPVPLSKLSRIALDGAIDPHSPDAGKWRVEHFQFWRVKSPKEPGASPRFEVTADMPADLQDRWFCVFELSNYGDYTDGWWKNLKYAVVMLDGTYVPLSPARP